MGKRKGDEREGAKAKVNCLKRLFLSSPKFLLYKVFPETLGSV